MVSSSSVQEPRYCQPSKTQSEYLSVFTLDEAFLAPIVNEILNELLLHLFVSGFQLSVDIVGTPPTTVLLSIKNFIFLLLHQKHTATFDSHDYTCNCIYLALGVLLTK